MNKKSNKFIPTASFNGGTLDCGNGLLLLIRKHIDPLEKGDLLEIISLESSVEEDLPAWCRLTKNELVSLEVSGEERKFLISKGPLLAKDSPPDSQAQKVNQSKTTENINEEITSPEPESKATDYFLKPIENFSVMGIGSWPRPNWLIPILHNKLEGKISEADFDLAANDAVKLSVQSQELAGASVITDGEQRRDNYASFVATKLNNCQLIPLTDLLPLVDDPEKFEEELSQLDVPASEIRHPAVFGKISRKSPLALNEAKFLRTITNKPIKVALPGPYLLTRTMWMECISDSAYQDRNELAQDIIKILREEAIDLLNFGVEIVQFDEPVLSEVVFSATLNESSNGRSFMCGALGAKLPIPEELAFASSLLEAVIKDLSKDRLAAHICRGNWTADESKALNGPYHKLLPYFENISVGTLFLEHATDRAGSIDELSSIPKNFDLGIGFINQKLERHEKIEEITSKMKKIISIRGSERKLYLVPDCGFATFADNPICTSENAKSKLQILSEAAKAYV